MFSEDLSRGGGLRAYQGKQVASFTVADSRCVLKDDQIRCTRVNK